MYVLNDEDQKTLVQVISETLDALEVSDEITITSDKSEIVAQKIVEAVKLVAPEIGLSSLEMYGVRSIILHAIANKSFFDWEMPTLTGFSAEQFQKIAEKLPCE